MPENINSVPTDERKLRDWFAGHALTATVELAGRDQRLSGSIDVEIASFAARIAYTVADAIMAERGRRV
jgi:hypothetical protein